jgi:hypothetical protein
MLTPFEIQEAIEAELTRMEALIDELRLASVVCAKAEADFKVGFAKARLIARSEGLVTGSKVTQDMAEDSATVATEDSRYAYLLASNNIVSLREAIKVSQSHLDGLRTLAASHRHTP